MDPAGWAGGAQLYCTYCHTKENMPYLIIMDWIYACLVLFKAPKAF